MGVFVRYPYRGMIEGDFDPVVFAALRLDHRLRFLASLRLAGGRLRMFEVTSCGPVGRVHPDNELSGLPFEGGSIARGAMSRARACAGYLLREITASPLGQRRLPAEVGIIFWGGS